jgi:diaminohydroxyphosphoribosylaminopyrimidine deaminase / 5-amino-6-(5-phosphoribosylamino)uracil reductase
VSTGGHLAVTLKLATSLDGRIATRTGASQWITGPQARGEVHRLRAAHDAVLTGIGTVLADDPELTARTDPPPARQPLRIILDTHARTPLDGRLARSLDRGPVCVCVGPSADTASLAAAGFLTCAVPLDSHGHVDIGAALAALADRHGLSSVLIEAGGQVAGAALRAGVVTNVEWFRAPILLGGDALGAVAGLEVDTLAHAVRLNRLDVRPCGPDLWERYEVLPTGQEPV